MRTTVTPAEALTIIQKYNKEPFHLRHAITVSAVMKWMAEQLGYADESLYWASCGMLHDVDFELYPDCHLENTPDILRDEGIGEDVIHTVVSHGYGHCSDVAPEHEMEKVLFAIDELTGIIWAAAKMRPSHSCTDMELSSLKKKFKDKKFAAGCDRDIIRRGAEQLGWELDQLMAETLAAMAATEDDINAVCAEFED